MPATYWVMTTIALGALDWGAVVRSAAMIWRKASFWLAIVLAFGFVMGFASLFVREATGTAFSGLEHGQHV